jgi:hypothetical protein
LRKQAKLIKRICWVLFFTAIIFPLCNCFSYYVFNIHVLEVPIHLKVSYGGSQFIAKISPTCGSSEIWPEYVYWLTQDDFYTVAQFYQQSIPNLDIAEDGNRATGDYSNSDFIPLPFLLPTLPDYISESGGYYKKVAIDLFNLSQPDLQTKARPGHCPLSSDDRIYRFLAEHPPAGTLIVYNYNVWKP